jgi:hypothetical protein
MRRQKPKCMSEDCNRTDVHSRGLCYACYQSWARYVRLGIATWRELEKKKICGPSRIGRAAFKRLVGK